MEAMEPREPANAGAAGAVYIWGFPKVLWIMMHFTMHDVLPNFWNVLWGHQRAYQSDSSQESSYISSPVSICSMVYPPESINWRRLCSSYSWTDLAPARLDPHVARIINWPFIMKNIWLVVYLPLWKMMEFVSWDYDISNIWKVLKAMFQSTNQTSFTSLVKAAWLRKPQRNFGQLVCPNPPCPGLPHSYQKSPIKTMERSRGCFQMVNNWHWRQKLVGGIPTPLKNMTVVGIMTFPIYGKIKHVPKHQPGKHAFSSALFGFDVAVSRTGSAFQKALGNWGTNALHRWSWPSLGWDRQSSRMGLPELN